MGFLRFCAVLAEFSAVLIEISKRLADFLAVHRLFLFTFTANYALLSLKGCVPPKKTYNQTINYRL